MGADAPFTAADLALVGNDGPAPAGGDTPPTLTREQELTNLRDSNIDEYRRARNEEGLTGPQEMLDIQRNKADGGNEADESGDAGDDEEKAGEVGAESSETSEADEASNSDGDVESESDDAERADDDASEQEDEPPSPVPTDPEERAEFLPDEPRGYGLPIVENHEWNDGAKASWASFAEVAHELELSVGAVDKIGTWFVGHAAEIQERFKGLDVQQIKATNATLREEWGDAYEANVGSMQTFFRALPKTLRTEIKAARLPSGKKLSANPDFLEVLLRAAQGAQQQGGPTIDQRLSEIDRIRKTDIGEFRRQGLAQEAAALTARKAKGEGGRGGAAPVVADADDRREETLARLRDTNIDEFRRTRNADGLTGPEEMLAIQRRKNKRVA